MNFSLLLRGAVLFLATCGQAMTTPDVVHNQYVVMLTKGMERPVYDSTMKLVNGLLRSNDRVHHTYFFHDFRGFSIEAPSAVIEHIRKMPGVEAVEPNYLHHAQQTQRIVQHNGGWGLDRISHHSNAQVTGRKYEFIYYKPAGAETIVYILDSGIYLDHNDFQGRAARGADFAPPNVLGNPDDGRDYNGHGTCAASITAGYDLGVAKFAHIIDVRVLNDNGSATYSSEIAGLDWAVNDAESRGKTALSAINFSIGGPANQHSYVVNNALQSAIDAGVFCGLSAGNNAKDSSHNSPGNTPDACTVGATDLNDNIATFSDYGDTVDIYAPGVDVLCAGLHRPNAVIENSGTSFAAPYVTGLAAYLKSLNSRYSGYTPQRLCRNMAQFGSKGYIHFRPYNQPTGPNIIAYDQQGEV